MTEPGAFPADEVETLLGERVLDVRSLPSSLNHVWCANVAGEQVVIRRSGQGRPSAPIVNFKRELQLHARAAQSGLAPKIIAYEPDDELLVTEFVGATISADALKQPRNLERLARRVWELHALGVTDIPLGPTNEVLLDTYRSQAPDSRSPTRQMPTDHGDCVICHHDVHAENVRDGSALQFIDWEYARVAPRMNDLGVLCENLALTDPQSMTVLEAYLGRTANKDELRQLRSHRDWARNLFSLWSALIYQ
ncbi:MAG: phosphotransferase [Pseudomonadota bacterium]